MPLLLLLLLLLLPSTAALTLSKLCFVCFCFGRSGSTRPETERSEARSYAEVAAANGYWGWLAAPVQHDDVLLEERALDSYHNILFSLTLFYSRFQAWPYRLTIISHAFKKPRLAGHCSAIGFPVQRLSLVGIDPPPAIISADGTKSEAMAGVKQAADQWADDPHGRGQDLASKRRRRNVWSVWQGLFLQGTLHQDKGGLVTRGEAEEETLVDDAPRPWP